MPSKYRIAVFNNATGASVTATVKGKPWKVDDATGKIVYGAEVTYVDAVAIADNGETFSTNIDNDVDGQRYQGLHLQLEGTPASSATGALEVFLQSLQDDDTAPDAAFQGFSIRALVWQVSSSTQRVDGMF